MLRRGAASLLQRAANLKSGQNAAAITTSAAAQSQSWFADVPTAPKVSFMMIAFNLTRL